jgi:hypothetical protein
MFRFTIRDVLWLTVVVASLTGWWLDHRRADHETKALRSDNLAKSEALESDTKSQAILRQEQETIMRGARRLEGELQKREAELRSALSKREEMRDALRTLKENPGKSN